ncbi:hypothetical protein MBOL_43270 [Mycobacteroides abscessus subsp. bolletii BD]|nr:hypothetical protein MBOL_43270 [Mycobacteroides abscessus subsp. bolletii BD]
MAGAQQLAEHLGDLRITVVSKSIQGTVARESSQPWPAR